MRHSLHACCRPPLSLPSEGQVVVGSCERKGFACGIGRRSLGSGGSRGYGLAIDAPGTYAVEPAVIPLTGVDVELNRNHFAHLDIEPLNLLFTEDLEAHLLRILVFAFYYVLLDLPGSAAAPACPTFNGEDGYHFTFEFHRLAYVIKSVNLFCLVGPCYVPCY